MAENLGTAVLRLEVDDTALREGLAQARRLIEGTSVELGRQTRSAGRAQRASAPGARLGGAREAADADIKARQRIIGVQNRINLLEAKGVDISQARARLSQAIVAEEQRNFGTVRRVTSQLSNTLKVEEGRLRVSAAQAAQLKRQEAAAKAVASAERGPRQRPTGLGFATTPEQILAGRGGTQRGAAQSLNAREAAADKLIQLRNRINILDAQGVKLSSQKATLENILQAANAGQLGTSRQLVQSLSRQLSIEENNLRVTKLREAADKRRASEAAKAARAAQSSQAVPSAGEPAIPGFIPLPKVSKDQQKRAQAASKRRADILSNALIGGAFPLLFGQGVGASFGGAAGGAAGGAIGGQFGFGLSLIGTALGAQFDTLLNKSKELADALQNPIAAFDQLKQASALSSRGLETYIQALINSGQTAKAEQLIRQDLTQNFNPVTADALSQANDELARSFSDVQEKLAAILAGPSIAFLEWLDDILDRLPLQGPGGTPAGQLPSSAAAEAQAEQGRSKQRAGLGLGLAALGTIAIGAALTKTGVGAPVGLGLIAKGLTGLGLGLGIKGKIEESQGTQARTDISTQRDTVNIQKQIEAIQARRITLQKQLAGFTGDEKSAAAQIAQSQNVALQAQEDTANAAKKFISLPYSPESLAEFKAGVEAARIELEKFIAANNNQARSLRKDNNLRESTIGFTPAARQGAELADASRRLREDYDKAQTALREATPGTNEYAALESLVNKIGEEWRGAALNVADYNAELERSAQRQKELNADTLAGLQQSIGNIEKLAGTSSSTGIFFNKARDRLAIELKTEEQVSDAKREQIRLQNELNRLSTIGTKAEIDNASALVEQAKARTQLVSAEGRLRLQEFDEKETEDLRKQSIEANENATNKFAEAIKEAATNFIQAADTVKSAAVNLRSAKEGALSFLQPEARRALVAQARADYAKQTGFGGGALENAFYGMQSQLSNTFARQSQQMGGGLFRKLPYNLSDEQVISAANAARSVTGAQDEYVKANKDLTQATIELAKKDWKINVKVLGREAQVYGDAVNEAMSGLSA